MDILKPSCPICDWPLQATTQEGCVEGSCCYRPDEGSQEFYRIQQRRDALPGEGNPKLQSKESGLREVVECPSCRAWRDECRLCGGSGEVTEQQMRDFGAEP